MIGLVVRALERFGVRGAPTLLKYLSKTQFGRGLTTVHLPSGQYITFPASDEYWCRYLYAGVAYEPDVEVVLRRFGQGRILIDCGANIGYWSVRASELGFCDAIAIEASAKLIPILQKNVPSVIHAAVYGISGEVLYLEGEGGAAALGTSGQPVTSLALNDLQISQPAVVKLDVEGAEIAAFQGATNLDAIFVYEDWPKSGMTVTEWLISNGYKISGYDETPIPNLEAAFEFNRRTNKTYGPSNLVAVRAA